MEITSVPSFLDYLDRVHERTRRVALCVREEDPEWQASAGRMTAGDLIRHLAGIERFMYAETVAALTDARLREKCQTPAGTSITVWKWLRAMIEHEAHHRGQLYFILGLRGTPTPPIYGLTSEEVQARSAVDAGVHETQTRGM